MNGLAKLLRSLGACQEALDWAKNREPGRDAWEECARADHLLWAAAKLGVERKLVVLAACACARTALKHVPEGEVRPLKAIEAAEAWTRGEASLDEVRKAARAAYAYAADDAYAYAAYAAADAADAAAAAYAAAAAAAAADAAAADAAYAYADAAAAAYAAAYAAARAKALAEMAALVRQHIPWSVIEAALAAREAA